MTVSTDRNKISAGLTSSLVRIYQDYADASWTGDTNETALKSYTVAAGHGLSAGCKIVITSLASAAANNANAKTFRVKIGNQSLASPSLASTLMLNRRTEICLVSLTAQRFFPAGSQTGYGVTASALGTNTIDLSGSFTISTTATLGNAGDTITDHCFEIDFIYV